MVRGFSVTQHDMMLLQLWQLSFPKL